MAIDAHATTAQSPGSVHRDSEPLAVPVARGALRSWRRLSRAVLLLALVAAAAALFRALAVECLEEDGSHFVEAAALRRGGWASWYHAAYMPLEALIEQFVGVGRAFDALLWSSALSAALGLAFVALASSSLKGGALVPLLALACSPGLLVQATRVELHALQFFGAAVLLHAVFGRAPRALLHLFIAALFAVACHRTNLGLVPGAAWIAATGSTPGGRVRSVVAVVAGAAVGHVVNRLTELESAGFAGLDVWLVFEFWQGPSAWHVWSELIVPWFPILVLVAFHAAWFDRRSVPFAAATLPLAAFFTLFGVGTSGGYFTGVCVFAAAAVADVRARRGATVESRTPTSSTRRVWTALGVAAVCLAGAVVGLAKVRAPERHELADIGERRHAEALVVLPRGGVLVCVDPSNQSVSGRTPGLEEMNLATALVSQLVKNGDPEAWAFHASDVVDEQIALGLDVVLDREWIAFAAFEPRLADYITRLEALLRERHGFVEETHGARVYLVHRASPSGGGALDVR